MRARAFVLRIEPLRVSTLPGFDPSREFSMTGYAGLVTKAALPWPGTAGQPVAGTRSMVSLDELAHCSRTALRCTALRFASVAAHEPDRRPGQRNAHLASAVRLVSVQGRDGQPVSNATLTAISNTRKGSGDNGGKEVTAILWTLLGKQADNAAPLLGKGSHVNVVGRVQNNTSEREADTVYSMAFTAEEVDYLDTKAEGETLRMRPLPTMEERRSEFATQDR